MWPLLSTLEYLAMCVVRAALPVVLLLVLRAMCYCLICYKISFNNNIQFVSISIRSLSLPQRFLEVTSTSGTKPVHNHSIHSLTADEKEDSHTRYLCTSFEYLTTL